MAKKRNIESAIVFERSGIRAIRVRAIEVLLYFLYMLMKPDQMLRITEVSDQGLTYLALTVLKINSSDTIFWKQKMQ